VRRVSGDEEDRRRGSDDEGEEGGSGGDHSEAEEVKTTSKKCICTQRRQDLVEIRLEYRKMRFKRIFYFLFFQKEKIRKSRRNRRAL
jgi:hypothetical protein